MTESPPSSDPHETDEGDSIFEPTEDDRDDEAEAQMQQGKADLDPENALYDPFFVSPEQAQEWRPGDTDEEG